MKKVFKVVLTSLLIILSASVVIGGVIWYMTGSENPGEEEQSVKAMNEFAYETPEITTDLEDGQFVRIQFSVITDGKKAQSELEDREYQVKNILIKEISSKEVIDFSDELSELEETVLDKLNDITHDGEVTDVYTTSKILQ